MYLSCELWVGGRAVIGHGVVEGEAVGRAEALVLEPLGPLPEQLASQSDTLHSSSLAYRLSMPGIVDSQIFLHCPTLRRIPLETCIDYVSPCSAFQRSSPSPTAASAGGC